MGEQEEEVGMKKRVVVESLGWLTESSIMPKKHRVISGVGPSSILELKAQLYQSQEDSKRAKEQSSTHTDHIEYQRAKKKISPHDPLALKNSGVDSRALKDKLELKAVSDGSASYAALERKAELYEKLAKGELSDEEEKEKYCVDFFSKSLMKDESQQPQAPDPSATESLADEDYENGVSELPNTKSMGLAGQLQQWTMMSINVL
ncbi:hypothetical protein U1Q18_047856 [Sarracenia purpurea var. burkii]